MIKPTENKMIKSCDVESKEFKPLTMKDLASLNKTMSNNPKKTIEDYEEENKILYNHLMQSQHRVSLQPDVTIDYNP